MHYKRRSRRLDKRRWAKCGCCEIIDRRKEPIEDGPSNGFPRAKKPRKPKDRCRVNRVHEWYREEVEETYRAAISFRDGSWLYDTVIARYKQATCIHCWVVKRERIWESSWRTSGRRKLALKKRVRSPRSGACIRVAGDRGG